MTQAQTSEAQEPAALLEQLSGTLVPELKRYVKHHRGEVERMIANAGSDCGLAASRRYAKVIDGLASALFHAARTAMLQSGAWRPVALSGVGSYGRSSLSIFSDLDVRLLCEDSKDVEPIAEALLYPLWDAGLNIGHQVVTANDMLELAHTDIPTATSLLDWRHLAGEKQMNSRFQQRVFDDVFTLEHLGGFIQKLAEGAEQRRERFGGSVFLLEPEIKNGAGGLRDVDLMHWAARARWRVDGLEELVRVGVLLPDEWTSIANAIEFIMRVRNTLHHRARRRVDRLTFDDQERISEALGYGSGGAAVESFMSEYYRQAREIERTCELVLRRATPPPKSRPAEERIDGGLKLAGSVIAFDDYDSIYSEPHLVFSIFVEAIKRQKTVADASRRAIMRAVSAESFCQQLRSDPEAAELFKILLCSVEETRFKYDSILTELHDVGLLLAMIPEFAPVVGRVHHDVYHVYTVDVHSIACVDRLRAIFANAAAVGQLPPPQQKPSGGKASAGPSSRSSANGSTPTSAPAPNAKPLESKQELLHRKYRLACKISEEITRQSVLFLAALLHDVGKDTGGAKHAERGVELAQTILERLNVPQDDINGVQHLILKHLRMYHVATRRDIDDPRTLENFSEEVQGTEGLRELFLLTVADVSTTSPTALTSWKRRMLEELFHATDRWLTHGETRRAAAEAITQGVMEQLPDDVDRRFADAVLHSMPPRYLGANNSEWIIQHLRLAQEVRDSKGQISVLRKGNPHVELVVIGDDHPGMLAQICATFSKLKLKVVSAQIYSFTDPDGKHRFLDLFWVRSGNDPDAVVQVLPQLNQLLSKLLDKKLAPRDLVSGKKDEARYSSRKSPAVPIQVRVDNEGATKHTILEVITKDRADLLFWISQMIYNAGLTIDLAKIHTEGVRVTDVFYVATEDENYKEHRKLLDESKIEDLQHSVKTTLMHLEGGPE